MPSHCQSFSKCSVPLCHCARASQNPLCHCVGPSCQSLSKSTVSLCRAIVPEPLIIRCVTVSMCWAIARALKNPLCHCVTVSGHRVVTPPKLSQSGVAELHSSPLQLSQNFPRVELQSCTQLPCNSPKTS